MPVIIGSQRQLGDLLSSAKTRAQAAVLRWCDAVICNSRAAAEGLARAGVPEQSLVVIPNGLPASAFAPCSAAVPRSGTVRAVMVARMNAASKNHSLLLRVASRLRDRVHNLEFLLAGDGPLRPQLEREAEALNVRDRVHFLGDRRDIPAVLRSADISVLPSASESLSNAIIESMAAELPAVAFRVGGNSELVSPQTGILVDPGDEEAFAEAIAGLAQAPARRFELGRVAREIALSRYGVKEMCRRHEELYGALLERKQQQRKKSKAAVNIRPPRVAIVAASLRYVGGQSAQADWLLQRWRNDRAIQVRFIPIDPVLPRWLSWVEKIPGLRTMVREPLYLWSLWRDFKHIDIAHIFSASYSSFLVAPFPAWIIARLRGKKTMIHYHSGEARDHLSKSALARWVLRRAQLIVPSGYLVDVFREFGLPSSAVPNMVDVKQLRFRERSPLQPHLICTRGFHPYYAVDVVVRAFAEVKQAFPEARLDLLGTGPTEPQVRALVRGLQIQGVHFCGVVPRPAIGRYYDAADIFINASRLDNMPVSVMEAFACGLPVITTAPEGMDYLVEHERTGLLSAVGNAQALAQNVIRVLNDPALASRLAKNAHEESARFDWRNIRDQWLEAYGVHAPAKGSITGVAEAGEHGEDTLVREVQS